MYRFLQEPVEKPRISSENSSVASLLQSLSRTAYQGKSLGQAVDTWLAMLESPTTIILGLAGAMIPAGMRELSVSLIENRLVDCIVATGANLFHDCHESLGRHHYIGSHLTNDVELQEAGVDRIYDVFASESEFRQTDAFIAEFALGLSDGKAFTTREFLAELGLALCQTGGPSGILTAAATAGIPLYCPAIGDSSIGIALGQARVQSGKVVVFDVIRDAMELAKIVDNSTQTGVIYIGGGTPKNFIQQAAIFLPGQQSGHKYAIQVTTDSPQWGGLSGCTFEEAQSWGKILPLAEKVSVHCDATIAFPLLAAAVFERGREAVARRRPPTFKFAGPEVIVEQ
ncbi:MAG: deoxyhypusine synthase family protein [Chloroflexi bacterium]|nr:deoxyhypusine synthase family protein [Chloroflexota bacterium]